MAGIIYFSHFVLLLTRKIPPIQVNQNGKAEKG